MSYKSNLPIAIVEAKDNKVTVSHGIQQAIGYASDLAIPFAFSSNGSGFYEHDMITGMEREIKLEEFPTPQQLWERYVKENNLDVEQIKIISQPYYYMSAFKTPRYYQRIAINKTVEAIAKGQKEFY